MASFMNETCRRTAWPSDAAACSAPRSGSASRTATSVMAEDISFNSCARTASMARNQNKAIGRPIVASTTIIIGLVKTAPTLDAVAITGDRKAQASSAPIASHPPEAAAAIWKGWLDGFCWSAKIRPPIDGTSSLAATRERAGPAGRRLAARLWPSSSGNSASGLAVRSGGGRGGGSGALAAPLASLGGAGGRPSVARPNVRLAVSRCVLPS
jgi:hypothetical protein